MLDLCALSAGGAAAGTATAGRGLLVVVGAGGGVATRVSLEMMMVEMREGATNHALLV